MGRTRQFGGVCAIEVPECWRSYRQSVYRWLTGSVEPNSPRFDVALLAPALEAARRALRKLDETDIPAALRDIAARSGRLPPPLARRLAQELDASEWLRAEAVAAWPDIDFSTVDGKHRASAMFLQRPQGWEDETSSLVEESAGAQAWRVSQRLAEDLGKAGRRIEGLESLLAKSEERARLAEESAGERLSELSDRLGRNRSRDLLEIKQLQSVVADLDERLAAATRARDEIAKELEATRGRRRPTEPLPTRGPGAWGARRPLEVARHLDDLVSAGAVTPVTQEERRGSGGIDSLNLPQGISPDRAEAIYWLLDQTVAVVVAIDGWNAAHLLASPPSAEDRQQIVEAGRRISSASRGRRRVIVVFDSRESPEQFTHPEVEVRYVASADEGILELAANSSGPLVVVSSDRRVREGAQAVGAVGLWSQALVDWFRTGGRRTFRT